MVVTGARPSLRPGRGAPSKGPAPEGRWSGGSSPQSCRSVSRTPAVRWAEPTDRVGQLSAGRAERNLDGGGCWFTLAQRAKRVPMMRNRDIFFGTRCHGQSAANACPVRAAAKAGAWTRHVARYRRRYGSQHPAPRLMGSSMLRCSLGWRFVSPAASHGAGSGKGRCGPPRCSVSSWGSTTSVHRAERLVAEPPGVSTAVSRPLSLRARTCASWW